MSEKIKGSIIIAVLESYEVVRRQILWYSLFMKAFPDWELILVDDGSDPAIFDYKADFPLRVIHTKDDTPWSQPRARNIGAFIAKGEYLLMTDVDHIITPEAISDCDNFTGDKLRFSRGRAFLDEFGALKKSEAEIREWGIRETEIGKVDEHYNTFCIRRDIHVNLMHGYDDRFCGKYGSDDTDYSDRYGVLFREGKVKRSEKLKSMIYVFPDPKHDRKHIFHDLRRKGFTEYNNKSEVLKSGS